MEYNLDQLQKSVEEELAGVKDAAGLERFRVAYLGRKKGKLNAVLRSLKDLPEVERRVVGPRANTLKQYLEQKIEEKKRELESAGLSDGEGERIDVTAPAKRGPSGHLHPMTQLMRKAIAIFSSMGFDVASGPEVETEYYNFDALNVPKDHPARDMQDTFWLDIPGLLLRTQTSPVQIRYMEKHKPPFRMIAPGKVFRNEATDATHEAQFYQMEGLMIGKDVSLANLKAILEVFYRNLLDDQKLKIRFRPSYFPFVEPGVETDLTCFKCRGKGCAVCKKTGWIEVMGAGMVHPKVLENAGIDSREWQGFAFGGGLDRIAMIKYGIDDIRLLYNGDLRFLKQF